MKARKFNFETHHAPEPGSRVAKLAALRTRRAEKARADLKRWQSKFKRARNMCRKLRARVKYYDAITSQAFGMFKDRPMPDAD